MADLASMTTPELLALRNQVVANHAINQNESGGAPDTATGIVNPASGARGNMQVMPATATSPGFGVKPSNGSPADDARAGRDYMAAMTQRYGDAETAAIAYNMGPGKTDNWIANGRDLSDLPTETLKYLKNFKAHVASVPPPPAATPAGASTPAPTPTLEQQVAANPPGGGGPGTTDNGFSMMPTNLGQDAVRQLGLTARAAGHGLADAAGVIGNPLNAAVNAIGQAIGHNPHLQDVDTILKSLIDKYTPAPQGALETGVNAVAEQMANPTNFIPMGQGGGVVRGALTGAAAAGMQPVHADTSLGDIAGNMAGGALMGGAVGGLGRVIAGANLSPEAQSLMDQGVTLTPGQAAGGSINSVEQKASSIPFVGEQIAKARGSALNDMNTALYNQVLAPIGETMPKGVVGRDAVAQVADKIGAEYDKVLPQVTFTADTQLKRDLTPIFQQVSTLPPDLQNRFNAILQRNIASQLQNGSMSGTTFKTADSVIGKEAANFASSTDGFQRDMAGLLKQAQSVMRDSLERTNPNVPSLKPINAAWRNYTVLRNAAARVNNPEAPIMAGQLQAAVKAGDTSVGKGAFAKGQANMQGLSDASMKVLGSNVPDSGTAGRGMLGGFLAGGGIPKMVAHPLATTAALGTAAAYGTNAGRQAMLAAVAKRPELMRAFGNNASLLAPQLGAGLALGVRKVAEGDR